MGRSDDGLSKRLGAMGRGLWEVFTDLTGTEEERIKVQFRRGKRAAKVLAADEDTTPTRRGVLSGLGARLAECTKECSKWEFRFAALTWPTLDAFALPGGFVFVTAGLMDFCQPDLDQLAFVLAHEMAHIVLWHAGEGPWLHVLSGIGSRPATGGMAGILAQGAQCFLEKQYSQELELDADESAVGLMKRAGFDAAAAVRLLQGLPGDSSSLGIYFSSHPPRDLRVRKMRRLVK